MECCFRFFGSKAGNLPVYKEAFHGCLQSSLKPENVTFVLRYTKKHQWHQPGGSVHGPDASALGEAREELSASCFLQGQPISQLVPQ